MRAPVEQPEEPKDVWPGVTNRATAALAACSLGLALLEIVDLVLLLIARSLLRAVTYTDLWWKLTPVLFLASIAVGVIALASAPTGPHRRRTIAMAVAGITISILLLGPWGILSGPPSQAGMKIQCLSNVKNLAGAMQVYLADNDNAFPRASDWRDAVDEYQPRGDEMACPMADSARGSYAYNAALSGAMYDSLSDAASTVAIFESDKGWNAAGGQELLTDVPRHLGGDNLGFADGHAAWWSRVRIKPDDPKSGWRKAYNDQGRLIWREQANQ
jgi:hypothetical protein